MKDDTHRPAVIAALRSGEKVTDIAKRLQLSRGAVLRIRGEEALRCWQEREVDKRESDKRETDNAARMDGLLCAYLETNLEALQAICDQVRDATWLRQQSAPEIAALHEELATTALRLFEALPGAEGFTTENTGGTEGNREGSSGRDAGRGSGDDADSVAASGTESHTAGTSLF